MADENLVKIAFELQQDEEGYPPDKWETLWASGAGQGGAYCIDNVPFYAKGISSGDVVYAEPREGQLVFIRLLQPSTNSVFRLYVADADDAKSARDSFRELGCESEQSHIPKLFAVEIPGSVAMEPVAALLDSGAEAGRWEYEQGVLRHSLAP
jgi:hypothetical protein